MSGVHITKLILKNAKWNEDVLVKILNSVPNLQSLELDHPEVFENAQLTARFLKLKNLKTLM